MGMIIRCVGDPVERFTEDAFRMLRAVAFSAQLGFTVEENTKAVTGADVGESGACQCRAYPDRACKASGIRSSGLSPNRLGDRSYPGNFFRNLTPVWKPSRIPSSCYTVGEHRSEKSYRNRE